MAIVQQINLNMIPDTIPEFIYVDQYDTGIGRIVAKLYNGSSEYIPSNATVKIQGTKPDKKGFSYDATISGNTVTSDLKDQMTTCYGDVRCQFVVTESTGRTGTFVFILRVQKSALQDDVDISETVLPEYIDGAQQAARDAQGFSVQAQSFAYSAERWASRSPYINPLNSHWMVFSYLDDDWIDSGISADGSTTSYNSLQNKPIIGDEEVNGEKNLMDYGLGEYLENLFTFRNGGMVLNTL